MYSTNFCPSIRAIGMLEWVIKSIAGFENEEVVIKIPFFAPCKLRAPVKACISGELTEWFIAYLFACKYILPNPNQRFNCQNSFTATKSIIFLFVFIKSFSYTTPFISTQSLLSFANLKVKNIFS